MATIDRFALMAMIASMGGAIVAKLDSDNEQLLISFAAFVISACVFVVLGLFE